MNTEQALAAMASLAQETRLAIFRLLIQAGRDGMAVADIGEAVGAGGATLSFHLANLTRAGLLSQQREGRSLIYSANFQYMNDLVSYLTENCCGNARAFDAVCCPGDEDAVNQQEPSHETPARTP